MFVCFFYGARMPTFLAGHAAAFEYFGGVARVVLYDNLKSAVLGRVDRAIRFHPTLLARAGGSIRPTMVRSDNVITSPDAKAT